MDVALALAHDSGLRRDVEEQLRNPRRRSAPSTRRRCRARRARRRPARARSSLPGSSEPRLLVALDRARVECVVLAHAAREVGAVVGVAHGARQHGRPRRHVRGVDRRAVLVERREHARHPLVGEAPAAVDADAQASHRAAPVELGQRAARGVDVGDQQARRVRPDVDDGDPHRRRPRGAVQTPGGITPGSPCAGRSRPGPGAR